MPLRTAYATEVRKGRWCLGLPPLAALVGPAILVLALAGAPTPAAADSAAVDQYSGLPSPSPQAEARARVEARGSAAATASSVPAAPARLPFTDYPVNGVVLALFSILVAAILWTAFLAVRRR